MQGAAGADGEKSLLRCSGTSALPRALASSHSSLGAIDTSYCCLLSPRGLWVCLSLATALQTPGPACPGKQSSVGSGSLHTRLRAVTRSRGRASATSHPHNFSSPASPLLVVSRGSVVLRQVPHTAAEG